MKKLLPLIIIFFFTISCENDSSKATDFKIEVPKNFQISDNLLDSALFQAMEVKNEIYLAVESVDKNSISLSELENEYIKGLFSDTIKTKIKKKKNKLEIEIKENRFDPYNWEINVLEGKDKYYILWIWTPSSKYKSNKSEIKNISNSFKLKN